MRASSGFLRLMAGLAVLAGLWGLCSRPASADDLMAIRRRGVLNVGVKADYPPFGFRSPSGEIIGIEPALAADVARSLGVRLTLVPVLAANRIRLLQDGKIDVIIATMNDTMERRHQVAIVKPYYYAAGYNVILPKPAAVTAWADLSGKTLCGIAAAYYNDAAATNFRFQLLAFATPTDALPALKDGRCAGLLYDDAALAGILLQPDWASYAMPLEAREVQPWGLAVRKNQPDWVAWLSDVVKQWIRDGTIMDLETQYHVPHSRFAETAHRQAAQGGR